jgi:hypothetical protein
MSEINIEITGNSKAIFLSLITDPQNNVMANCGANPHGRSGITLYRAAINTSNNKEERVYLEYFMLAVSTKILN